MTMRGGDYKAQRETMVRNQLAQRGIRDSRVLAAMGRVPRERFVRREDLARAYSDSALPIECDQTISQPYMVALMTQVLELSGEERVLEVGTGSGYQTAILAELSREVVSIERHEALSRAAGSTLEDLAYRNVTLVVDDGTLGWPTLAPYDRIMVTAAAERCPMALFDQLDEGGLIAIPVGDRDHQVLQVIRKRDGRPVVTRSTACRFVPLVGADGWVGG